MKTKTGISYPLMTITIIGSETLDESMSNQSTKIFESDMLIDIETKIISTGSIVGKSAATIYSTLYRIKEFAEKQLSNSCDFVIDENE
jgi:hypothetical protein